MKTPILCHKDLCKLDKLIGLALIDDAVCRRLLTQDKTLVTEFDIPTPVWRVIRAIRAETLINFCEQLNSLEQSDTMPITPSQQNNLTSRLQTASSYANINPHKRLLVMHPIYTHKHHFLTSFVFEPDAAYIRFDGTSLHERNLLHQIMDAVPSLDNTSYLVLDECDRAKPSALEAALTTLLKQYSGIRIVIFSRRFPQSLIHNPILCDEIQVVMCETEARFQSFNVNPCKIHIEVYALGSGRVFVNGVEIVEWEGQLPRNLFFYMIDNPSALIDNILETFWADLPHKKASNIFHVTKGTLHNILGFQLIDHHNESYRVHPNVTLYYDVQEFIELTKCGIEAQDENSLAKAQALFRYDFLQTNEQEWINKRREELYGCFIESLETLASIKYKNGDAVAALYLYGQVWRNNPLREDIATTMIEIYLRLNQAEKAFEIYWQTAEHVRATVGIEVGTTLQQRGAMAQRQHLAIQITHKQREKNAS